MMIKKKDVRNELENYQNADMVGTYIRTNEHVWSSWRLVVEGGRADWVASQVYRCVW